MRILSAATVGGVQMKRLVLVFVAILLIAGFASAQDLQRLGRDFEVVIEELGGALLPSLQQTAIWGQYPGIASYADTTNFFIAQSFGAVISPGILGFVEDTDAFEVLNVPGLFQGLLDAAGNDTVSGLFTTLQTFFPVPIVRVGTGFAIGEVEVMLSGGGFPNLLTGFATGLAGLEGINLGMGYFGGKVRRGLLDDAGAFPAISLGGGYSYSGVNIGYSLGADDQYTQQEIDGLGVLNFQGDLAVGSQIHTFGLDLQLSKALGFFVPYVGLSPYYHIARFGGSVGSGSANPFDAFIDFDGDGGRDVIYDGTPPDTTLVDDNLSLVVYGGFDMILGGFVIQIGGSWSVAKGAPAASLTFRLQ